MDIPVVIVGAGLSGLTVARQLSLQQIPYVVLEARGRPGGRILSESVGSQASASAVDLGPSWFWPGQHHLETLIAELGLNAEVYEQYSAGLSVIEYAGNQIEHRAGGASMAGSLRLDGGIHRLIDALYNGKKESVRLNAEVTKISQSATGVTVQATVSGEPQAFNARHVVLAVPPRVVAHRFTFDPVFTAQQQQSMQHVPTWMAAHAKVVALYKTPFWREQNLSGDAMSQIGPCVEIHDATPRSASVGALFGFVGVPATHRRSHDKEIQLHAIAQFARLFGDAAAEPLEIYYKDWAVDRFTATPDDINAAAGHATTQIPDTLWQNRIVLAGTETAGLSGHSNGYLEGAVEAGVRAADRIAAAFTP